MNIFEQITPNTLILTPNRRLSAYYLKHYQQLQLEKGHSCWATLNSLPLSSWLEKIYKEYTQHDNANAARLLNPTHELFLWEDIITRSDKSEHLLQVSATAELAKSAWGLLKQWRIELNHPTLKLSEDSHTFLKWAEKFQAQCLARQWIDQNSLPNFIAEKIRLQQIPVPTHIIFAGFTEISPQIKFLIEHCKQQGCTIDYYLQENRNKSANRLSLADTDSEIRNMARWAKAKTGKVACIISNLEDQREKVTRIFTEVFSEKHHHTLDVLSMPFNISAGRSLASYPVIHTALQLLSLLLDNISLDNLSHILRSPFVGDAETEMLRRAEFNQQLHRDNIPTITLSNLIKNNIKPDLFAKRIKNVINKLEKIENKLTISAWVKIFCDCLKLFGWPGERSINSEEYQVIHRWMDLLNEFANSEDVLTEINYKTALHYLKRMTSIAVFQPQSPETSIQILGLLEAAEIPFDHMWVMGMDDNTWPPAPKPNPFIPQHLQKSLLMPHATADRELQFCEKITLQLHNCAESIIFSHALHNDEFEVRASALIESIPEITLEQLCLSENNQTANTIYHHQQLETLTDDIAPGILTTEPIRGGARIFELQAACPFKAFAEIRLHAKSIDPATHGLRAVDRGNIMHNALELIWKELKNSNNLITISELELQSLIQDVVHKSLQSYANDQTTYLALESQRLQKLINHWLDIEKQRPPFVVIAQEQQYEINIANLTISLRVDRIDEVKQDEQLIIDYKTGNKNQPNDWFGQRPDAPQLPLYCILNPDQTIGIAFAMINAEKMGLKGVSKYNLNIKSIDTLAETNNSDENFWEEQVHHWRKTLETLGEHFCNGQAEASPKDGLQTCEYCQLKPLCRIYEKQTL